MRVAPLGAFYAGDPAEAARQAALSATVTHAHPEAVAGAITVAVATAWAVSGPLPPGPFIDRILEHVPPGKVHDGIAEARRMLTVTDPETAACFLGNGWTVSWLGGVNGDVLGLGMPPEQVRATFAAWRQALRLESVKETPIRDTGIVSMVGRTYRGIIRISLTARAYYPLPDDTEPVAESARERGTTPAVRPDRLHAGPLIPPRPSEATRPQHTL